MNEKEKLLAFIAEPTETDARNRMGCSENWYEPYYCIAHTFSEEEINQMTEHEIDMLVKLAETIGEALY
jgi:hypothetical protein